MARVSFILLAALQLIFTSWCEPQSHATKEIHEPERDSSGVNPDYINGFVEQPPPDAILTPPPRGPPATEETTTAKSVITSTTNGYKKQTDTSASPKETTAFSTQEVTKQDQEVATGTEVSMQTDAEVEGGGDMDLGCPIGPQSSLFRGFPGRDGMPGRDGNPGTHGIPGHPGSKGEPGSCDCREELKRLIQSNELHVPNIHQCSWNKLNWSLEAGKVVTCTFNKKFPFTSLKVEWFGALRILCNRGSACCNRWYITFNGAECANPMTIDGVIFTEDHNATINIHRSTAIAGICSGLPQGLVDVSLWTAGCEGIYPTGPSRTGWNSASRLIIEEIPM